MTGGDDRTERWHERTRGHIDGLRAPEGPTRRESAFELLDRTATAPQEAADHLDALFSVLEGEASAERWVAAAAIAHVADGRPEAVAPHADRLLGHVAAEAAVREPVSSALCAVVPRRELPVAPLLAAIERGDESAAEAVDVLAVVAVTRPETLPRDRLERLAEEGTATAACAQYLLTLLSAVGGEPDGGEGPPAPYPPDRSGLYGLSRQLTEQLPSSRANQFLTEELFQQALDEFLGAELDACGYRGFDVAKTPNGTQLVIRVEIRPAALADAPTPAVLVDELGSRFDLDSPDVEIRTVE
jgi:hypothetical protein